MFNRRFKEYNLILASQSPRRQYLLKELGLEFEIQSTCVPEDYPENHTPAEVAVYLAELKAECFDSARLPDKTIVIAADTIVTIDG